MVWINNNSVRVFKEKNHYTKNYCVIYYLFNSKKIDNGIFFKISGIDIGKYEIFLNHKLVLKGSFDKVGEYYDVMIEKKYLNKGKNQLLIKTNIKITLAGPTYPRLLTFSIKDFPEQWIIKELF